MNHIPTEETKLTLNEQSRLVILEQRIKTGVVTFVQVGNSLIEIREKKLWRNKYDSFDEYCELRWGWSRGRAQHFISATTAVQGLTKENATAVANEASARELVKVEPEKRNEVVTKAVVKAKERGKTVDAPIIREVKAEISKNGKHEAEPVRDDTKYIVPAPALPFWERRFEVKALIESIQQVKNEITKAFKEEDLLYFGKGKLNQTFTTDLEDVIRHLKSVMPYAVCPYCQGKIIDKCSYCNKTGVIDRNRFNAAPEQLLKMREAVVKGAK